MNMKRIYYLLSALLSSSSIFAGNCLTLMPHSYRVFKY